jgi:hypothetical protein
LGCRQAAADAGAGNTFHILEELSLAAWQDV